MEQQVEHLRSYMEKNYLLQPHANGYPLFYNSRKEKLTRAGLHHILQCYARLARERDPNLIPDKISPHSLRHSKAMHLLQAGVNLVYIRDILGHESVQTTEVYARVDSKHKREAIEKAYADVVKREVPQWVDNVGLLEWLVNFR
jgi:site-specific recombinase XerD